MNNTDLQRLLESAIIWDRPFLRRSDGPGARSLVEALDLDPRLADESRRLENPKEPLELAAEGLRLELTGDTDSAQELYSRLAATGATSGLIGKLLIAWMSTADLSAFQEVDEVIPDERPLIQVRARLKLMTWAKSRGWAEFARRQYDQALTSARGELSDAIQFQGHWFGRRQTVRMTPLRGALVLYPWIIDASDRSAGMALDASTKRLGQSSSTRVFGGGPPEGREIQSAELQAEWAGAHWLLPQLWRRHASILFNQGVNRDTVTRALSLWVRGSGSNITGLIERYEADLSASGASEILVDELKEGGATKDDRDWIKACVALWDQMPDALADRLIRELPLPDSWVTWAQQPTTSEPLSLFAVLATRNMSAWSKRFVGLSTPMQSLVIRNMSVGVVAQLEPRVKSLALRAVLSDLDNDEIDESWRDLGWSTIARLAQDVGSADEQQLLSQKLTSRGVLELAVDFPNLVPEFRVEHELRSLSENIQADLTMMSQGTYGFGGPDSCVAAMKCMIRLGRLADDVLELIIRVATSPVAAPFQASGALRALRRGVSAGIVAPSLIGSSILGARTDATVRFWDDEVEARLERVERAALQFTIDTGVSDGVVAATKDPDVRVRRSGLVVLFDVATSNGYRSPILDTCIMGGLYDPEPPVQEIAARAIVRGFVVERTISEVCWARMVEVWGEAHRSVRAAIALELGESSGSSRQVEELRRLAQADRSAMVRLAGGSDRSLSK